MAIFNENHTRTSHNFSSNLHNLVTVKLDHTNFDIWQKQITLPLRAYRLFRFVDGTLPCPTDTIINLETNLPEPNPDHEIWLETDALVLSSILSTLSPSLLPTVNHHKTSANLWVDLAQTYTVISVSHIHDLKDQLAKVAKTTTMEAYLTTIRTITDKLAVAGAQLSDIDLVHATIRNLPPDYKSLTTFVRNTIPPVTFNRLCMMLTDEEIHVKRDEATPTTNTTTALVANHITSPSPNQQQSRNNRGGYRGGHSRGGGRFSSVTRGPRPTNPNGETCQLCGRNNHLAPTCYTITRNRPKQALFVGSPSTPQENNNNTQPWYFDSGANNHLTHNFNNLHVSQPYKDNDQVTVGNGSQLPIHDIGDGLLPTPSKIFSLSKLLFVPSISHNLLSVFQFSKDNNCSLIFDSHGLTIQDMITRRTISKGHVSKVSILSTHQNRKRKPS